MIGGKPSSLNELLESFPEWHDDATARSLLSPFSQPRSVNPDSFDARMRFWRRILIESTRGGLLNGSVFVLPDSRSTAERLARNGLRPLGIASVVKDLVKNGLAKPAARSIGEEQASTDYLILRLARLSLSWGWKILSGRNEEEEEAGRMSNNSSSESEVPSVVLNPLVKEAADLFLAYFREHNEHALLPVVSLEDFRLVVQQCRNSAGLVPIKKLDDFDILIKYLESQAAIGVCEDAMVGTMVKVRTMSEGNLSISPDEYNIVRVRYVQSKLSKRVESLSAEVYRLKDLAREAIRKQDRSLAVFELRRSKGLERSREQSLAALGTIQEIIAQIDSARSSNEIVRAYKAGEQALKSILASSNVNMGDVDDVMLSLAESMNLQEELATALATPVTLTSSALSGIDDTTTLDEELEELMADSSAQPAKVSKGEDVYVLPPLPQDLPTSRTEPSGNDVAVESSKNSLIVE